LRKKNLLKKISAELESRLSNNYKKVRVFCQDESRFGLMPIKRKSITNKGVKPIGRCNFNRESFWIYGATDIISGESIYWDFETMSQYNFDNFIKDLSETYSDSLNIILIDNSRIHNLSEDIQNISFINIPPYNPELNPQENVWRFFKKDMGYLVFEQIEDMRKFVYRKIAKASKKILKPVVSYPYIIEALKQLGLI